MTRYRSTRRHLRPERIALAVGISRGFRSSEARLRCHHRQPAVPGRAKAHRFTRHGLPRVPRRADRPRRPRQRRPHRVLRASRARSAQRGWSDRPDRDQDPRPGDTREEPARAPATPPGPWFAGRSWTACWNSTTPAMRPKKPWASTRKWHASERQKIARAMSPHFRRSVRIARRESSANFSLGMDFPSSSRSTVC